MDVEDLRAIQPGASIEADICIVGSGPAGWAMAEELQDSALSILMLESGGLDPHPEVSALNDFENIGLPFVNGRERVLGGTSHIWTGRCIPLAPIDYEARAWVPHSGWPLDAQAMLPYVNRAGEYMNAGPYELDGLGQAFKKLPPQPALDPALLSLVGWEFPRPHFNTGERLRAHRIPGLRIIVHATVTHINTDADGSHVESLEVADPEGTRRTIRARAVALCAGGVENARILLFSNRQIPNGVGNQHDVVGRYFMDHPRDLDMAVRFAPADAPRLQAAFGPHILPSPRGGVHEFFNGLAFSAARQRSDRLLNCAAWPIIDYAADDPLIAANRLVKRKSENAVRDAWSVVSQTAVLARAANSTLMNAEKLLHRRKVEKIGFVIGSEQVPDPESRIRLGRTLDRFGLPISEIHWKVHEKEKVDQAELARTIAREFQRVGLPEATLTDWVVEGRYGDITLQDGSHPIGSTRMADHPRQGVVDANGQVHGVDGLFIAGSSVFPTGGHANPTLMIVALAVRLARHLEQKLSAPTALPALGSADGLPVQESTGFLIKNDMPVITAGTRAVITGATGFIGGRLAECLVQQGASVTCLLRSEKGSARLLQAGASVEICDLTDADKVGQALAGVNVIFHCAYDWHDTAWNYAALRALMAACAANRCQRLVHISSFDVYKIGAQGEITETTARTDSEEGYAYTKRELEAELITAWRETGLPATILQPTIVYGPFSRPWTLEPVDKLCYGTVVLPDGGEGCCNAVYVDDVVNAMILAAQLPVAIGQRFLISGPKPITWAEFYGGMARAAGAKGPLYRPSEAIERETTKIRKALRLVTTPERLARRVAQIRLVGKLLMTGMRVLPITFQNDVKDRLFGEASRRRGYIHFPNLDFLRSTATITSEKARRELGYAPKFDFATAMVEVSAFLRDRNKASSA